MSTRRTGESDRVSNDQYQSSMPETKKTFSSTAKSVFTKVIGDGSAGKNGEPTTGILGGVDYKETYKAVKKKIKEFRDSKATSKHSSDINTICQKTLPPMPNKAKTSFISNIPANIRRVLSSVGKSTPKETVQKNVHSQKSETKANIGLMKDHIRNDDYEKAFESLGTNLNENQMKEVTILLESIPASKFNNAMNLINDPNSKVDLKLSGFIKNDEGVKRKVADEKIKVVNNHINNNEIEKAVDLIGSNINTISSRKINDAINELSSEKFNLFANFLKENPDNDSVKKINEKPEIVKVIKERSEDSEKIKLMDESIESGDYESAFSDFTNLNDKQKELVLKKIADLPLEKFDNVMAHVKSNDSLKFIEENKYISSRMLLDDIINQFSKKVIDLNELNELATRCDKFSDPEIIVGKLISGLKPDQFNQLFGLLISKEIASVKDPATLLRGNTFATKLLAGYIAHHLGSSMDAKFETILKKNSEVQLSARALEEGHKANNDEKNFNPEEQVLFKNQLKGMADGFASEIIPNLPKDVKSLLTVLENEVNKKYPGKGREVLVANLFLRSFNTKMGSLSKELMLGDLMTKSLQKLASGLVDLAGSKDSYLRFMNEGEGAKLTKDLKQNLDQSLSFK